jgi:thioester reductase-like protein
MKAPIYFVTGASGFLGRELLVRLLKKGDSVLITTRKKGGESPEEARRRMEAIVAETEPDTPFGSAEVIFADVSEPELGLDRALVRRLETSDQPVHLVHGAAEVRFDLPWDVMQKQNVQGTEHVLALARRLSDRGKLARLDYVSTAYVAGDRTGLCQEAEIDLGQGSRNDYERSKLAAEVAVDKAAKGGLPITVHRPSIIVGDSRTGRASSFKVLYWPLKLYARGRWRTVFGRPDCPMDVVPVDFVADAMMVLMHEPKALGRRFHLAAGPDRQSTIGELVKIAEKQFGRGSVRYIDPDLYLKYLRPIVRPFIKLARPDVADKGKVFLPYLKSNPTFDVTEANAFLSPAKIAPPKLSDYFGTIMRYAEDTDFGRKAV